MPLDLAQLPHQEQQPRSEQAQSSEQVIAGTWSDDDLLVARSPDAARWLYGMSAAAALAVVQ